MSGRKSKAVAQRSNSNRIKHDHSSSSQSTASKPHVEPPISTSTEDAKQFLVQQDRTGLTLNNLNYLSQDGLLLSCFLLTLLHFHCQMYLLYQQEFQYWNWRQVSLSAAGMLNVYAAISPDKKKESLYTMLKAIWKAEQRVQALSARMWAIVESDEVNLFFSAALVVTMFFVTVDHSLNDITNPFIATNWIVSVVLLSLKTRDARWINHLVQQSLTLAWPETSFAFVLETLWVFVYTYTSGLFFATIAPRWTAYSTVGHLVIRSSELTVVTCSLALVLPPVLLMYLIQTHRCQLYLHVRQLHRFYSEQHAPALPWRDRLVGTVVQMLHRWLCHEISSVTRWNGHRPTVTVAWSLVWLSLYVLTGVAFFFHRGYGQELCPWILILLAGAIGSMALVGVFRPRYVVDTTVRLVKRRPVQPSTATTATGSASATATATAGEESSPEDGNSPAVSPDGHTMPPPSQRMAALFALDTADTVHDRDHDRDHDGTTAATTAPASTTAALAPSWPSMYSVEHLEGQLQSIKAFHSSLLDTFTYQQLQSSVQRKARSPSASMAMAGSSFSTTSTSTANTVATAITGAALTSSALASMAAADTATAGGGVGGGGGGAGMDLTTSFSQLSLSSMVGCSVGGRAWATTSTGATGAGTSAVNASSHTAAQPSTGSVSSASGTATAAAHGNVAGPPLSGDGPQVTETASWLGQLDHVVDASEAGSVSSMAALAWQQSVLQGVTADTPLPTVTIASPSLLRPPSHHHQHQQQQSNGVKTMASATTASASDTAPTTSSGSRSHNHHRKTRGAHNHQHHAANKLSIDVSSAMVGGGNANGPSSLTSSSPPHPATPPAVTILSITHHHGTAASVASASAVASTATATATASSSSSGTQQPSASQPQHHHPPAPGLSLQRKSKSLDRPSSFATSSPTAASASASSRAEFPSPSSSSAAPAASANRSQQHRSAKQGHHHSHHSSTTSASQTNTTTTAAAAAGVPAIGPPASSSSSLPRR